MQSIHCKVCARDSIRRFVLSEAKFSVLQQTVNDVFGLASTWVIKYKDEEDTLVTISSDEELAFAVQLMGSLLHMVVVEPLVNSNNQPKLEEIHQERAKNNNADLVLVHLTKKQANLNARLSVLKTAENPRQQAQVPKLEQKLARVDTQIAELSGVPKKPQSREESTISSSLPLVVVPPPSSPSIPQFDMKMMKEASKKFQQMRSNFQKEQKKIQSLVAVVQALKVLSRHGSKAQSPVQVDDQQAQLAQASLVSSKQELSAMKAQLKKQAELIKQLQRQRKVYVNAQKLAQKDKQKKRSQKEEKRQAWNQRKKLEESEKLYMEEAEKEENQPEEKLMRQAEKAQKLAQKAKRQELKATKLAQRAERQALKVKWQEEKAKSQEEKRLRQLAKKQASEAVEIPDLVETAQN